MFVTRLTALVEFSQIFLSKGDYHTLDLQWCDKGTIKF